VFNISRISIRGSIEMLMMVFSIVGHVSKKPFYGFSMMFLSIFVICCIVWVKRQRKINLGVLFDIICFFMIYIGAAMFGKGLALLMPNFGEDLEKIGMLAYGLPVLYVFLKVLIKDYIKNNV
jgi:high-affinity iron transporter